MGVSPFGNPRIEAYLQLPEAYRSLSRPSSAPDAKAFTLRSFSLELSYVLSCLSFANNCFRFLRIWKSFFPFSCYFLLFYSRHFRDEIVVLNHFFGKTKSSFLKFVLLTQLSVRFLFLLYLVFNEHFLFISLQAYWWAQVDSNHRPRAYQARALTTWAMSPFRFRQRFVSIFLPLVEMMGFEPMTPCLQGRCSPNWATPP